MPLVSVQDFDASADYLDVAHLAEDGRGGQDRRSGSARDGHHGSNGKRDRSNNVGTMMANVGTASVNSIDPDALVHVPAFSSPDDMQGLMPGGISSMIVPRYLSSHARPPEVRAKHHHDSAHSLDDVSVMTLDTCLRQMDTSAGNASGELSEREMAYAAARGEYNARIAAMSQQNSEVQSNPSSPEKDQQSQASAASGVEKQNAYSTSRGEGRIGNDVGRSGKSRTSASASGLTEGSDYLVPLKSSNDNFHHHHHSEASANTSGRSRPHNRSSLQHRYSTAPRMDVNNRSQFTHDTSKSSHHATDKQHRSMRRRSSASRRNQQPSLRTIESDVASTSNVSRSERSHQTQEPAGRGLGASMWTAKVNREERRARLEFARSRTRESAQQLMERALREENARKEEKKREVDEQEDAVATAAASSPTDSERRSHEKEKKTEHNHNNQKDKTDRRAERQSLDTSSRKSEGRSRSLADEIAPHSSKEAIEKQRECRGQTRDNDSASRPAESRTGMSLRALRTAASAGITSTASNLRSSFNSGLDDLDDELGENADDSQAFSPPPSTSLMRSASGALSNLAREAKTMSHSTDWSARGLLNRQHSMDEGQAAIIADLKSELDSTQEALRKSENQVAELEGQLAHVTAICDSAERRVRLIGAENDALQRRVAEMERREFGRAMGMTTGRAGMMSSGNTVSPSAAYTVGVNGSDRHEHDAREETMKKNRVEPVRQGSTKSIASLGIYAQDIDLESVVSGDGTKSTATGHSADRVAHEYESTATSNDNYVAKEANDKSSYDIAQQINALPSGDHENMVRASHKAAKQDDEGSGDNSSAPTLSSPERARPSPHKRGIFGLGRFLDNLHNESFAVLETLQEENTETASAQDGSKSNCDSDAGARMPAIEERRLNGAPKDSDLQNGLGIAGARSNDFDNLPTSSPPAHPSHEEVAYNTNKVHDTIDPAEVADEISHKLSIDIRSWDIASNGGVVKEAKQSFVSRSGETATTASESHQSPQSQAEASPAKPTGWLRGLPLRKHRDSIMKLANGSISNLHVGGAAEGTNDAASVISAGGFSVRSASINLSMQDELG